MHKRSSPPNDDFIFSIFAHGDLKIKKQKRQFSQNLDLNPTHVSWVDRSKSAINDVRWEFGLVHVMVIVTRVFVPTPVVAITFSEVDSKYQFRCRFSIGFVRRLRYFSQDNGSRNWSCIDEVDSIILFESRYYNILVKNLWHDDATDDYSTTSSKT